MKLIIELEVGSENALLLRKASRYHYTELENLCSLYAKRGIMNGCSDLEEAVMSGFKSDRKVYSEVMANHQVQKEVFGVKPSAKQSKVAIELTLDSDVYASIKTAAIFNYTEPEKLARHYIEYGAKHGQHGLYKALMCGFEADKKAYGIIRLEKALKRKAESSQM